MWHYSTLRSIEHNWWKLMIRNHLLILPSFWNNSINVSDKLCYRKTTSFRFVSCIPDSLPLQKSQLLCWLLWIAPPQDVLLPPMFPTCWTRQKAGLALVWAFLIRLGYNWLLPHTGISYLPLEILNCSYLFFSVGKSFVFFNFLASDFLASWRSIIWLSLHQIWL